MKKRVYPITSDSGWWLGCRPCSKKVWFVCLATGSETDPFDLATHVLCAPVDHMPKGYLSVRRVWESWLSEGNVDSWFINHPHMKRFLNLSWGAHYGGIYLVLSSNTLSIWGPYSISFRLLLCHQARVSRLCMFMWGPYLVHKRILMIDKKIQHAVDCFSKAWIKVVAHMTRAALDVNQLRVMPALGFCQSPKQRSAVDSMLTFGTE